MTAIDASDAAETVKTLVPVMPANVAEIVDVPGKPAVARPFEPLALLMEATPSVFELQVTAVDRSRVEVSEYVPVAVNCCVKPRATVGVVGEIAIELKLTAGTVTVTVAVSPPKVPTTVAVPEATPVMMPRPPELEAVTMLVLVETQVPVLVKS